MLVNIANNGINNFTKRKYIKSKSQIVHDFPYSSIPQNHPG